MIWLESIHWNASYQWPLVVVYGLLLYLVVLNVRRQYKSIAAITLFHQHLVRNFLRPLLWVKAALIIVAIIALYGACMRPQWGFKEKKVISQGRDVMIALDVSRSMLAEVPTRLECAKKKIKDLVYALQADRVGLILFSDIAFVQCPLTIDRAAFFLFLDAIDKDTMAEGSTSFEAPIKKALEVFETMPEKQTRLLLLITDGEDFSNKHEELKDLIRKQNISLWCLGVGTPEGAPIPLFDEEGNPKGHLRDRDGSIVISRFNQSVINELVRACGGHYLHITQDNYDIAELVKWVNRYEKQQNSEALHYEYEDRFYWFTGFALVCFILYWVL